MPELPPLNSFHCSKNSNTSPPSDQDSVIASRPRCPFPETSLAAWFLSRRSKRACRAPRPALPLAASGLRPALPLPRLRAPTIAPTPHRGEAPPAPSNAWRHPQATYDWRTQDQRTRRHGQWRRRHDDGIASMLTLRCWRRFFYRRPVVAGPMAPHTPAEGLRRLRGRRPRPCAFLQQTTSVKIHGSPAADPATRKANNKVRPPLPPTTHQPLLFVNPIASPTVVITGGLRARWFTSTASVLGLFLNDDCCFSSSSCSWCQQYVKTSSSQTC